jgi:lipopolysaccharide export system protein LptC
MLDPTPDNRLPPAPAPKRVENFAGLTPRWRSPRDALRRAHYYSRFVKFMKGVLPLAAFGIGGAVLFYATQHKDLSSFALTFERMGRIQNDLTMIHPRLTGTEEDGSPYTINAETAIQEDPKSMRLRLHKLDGIMTSSDGTQLHLIATEGRYDASAHTLFVFNGARLLTGDGYDMRTTAATINTKEGLISGDQRVIGDGPAGHLEADSFVANKHTKHTVFTGHVHMLLNQTPSAAKPAAAKAGDKTAKKSAKKTDAMPKDAATKQTDAQGAPGLRASTAEAEK